MMIPYKCPPNITSFSQCTFPDGVDTVYCNDNLIESFKDLPESVREIYCENNQIKSFEYLPKRVKYIRCGNNQIKSFEHLPGGVQMIWCPDNLIESFQYLPGSVYEIYCQNNNIKSFQYLPEGIEYITCDDNQIQSFKYLPRSIYIITCNNNPCFQELISKGLTQIYHENDDSIISDWDAGIEKLRYMRLNYLIHSLWKRYWYDQRDNQGYSRACRYIASKQCPNGYLEM